MIAFPLAAFTGDAQFPFFIQFGAHADPLYRHKHEDFSELVIVLEGTAEHLVNQEQYRVQKGDVFVIHHGTEHAYENVRDFRICNLMFRPEFLLARDLDITQSAGFQALFVLEPHYAKTAHFCSRLRLSMDDFVAVRMQLDQMLREYEQKQPGWQTLLHGEFLHLVVMLSRMYHVSSNAQRIGDGVFSLATAMAYIEQHFSDELTIPQLAKLSGYSPRHFIRLFSAAFGCQPTAYITNLRMKKAQQLLKMSALPIAEIAARCGYSDHNYFSRLFRRCNGCTPSAYRQTYGSNGLRNEEFLHA